MFFNGFHYLEPVHTMPAEFENGTKFLRCVHTIPMKNVTVSHDQKCETVTLTVRV